MNYNVIAGENHSPIKAWVRGVPVEDQARTQLLNIASLPFIHHHVAVMPDVHWGMGATVGSVIATRGAIVPAAVGVDIGCGMVAVRTSLKASQLPDNLKQVRSQIERDVPVGFAVHRDHDTVAFHCERTPQPVSMQLGDALWRIDVTWVNKSASQLGTLGGGNHFIEICTDESQDVWIMLHSGSRGIGNQIGRYFIEKAKRDMERYYITLPDVDLAYIPEGSPNFDIYCQAVEWAQQYAAANRQRMLELVITAMLQHLPEFTLTREAINCFPGTVKVSAEDISRVYRRRYDGQMVVIKTTSGRYVPVTPNHPLLTERGWVRADAIQKGDKLVCASGADALGTGVDPHVDGNPPTFSQLFDTLDSAGRVERVFGGPVEFHGDVDPAATNREVEIVPADGKLRYGVHTAFFEQAREKGLLGTDFASSHGFSGRLLREFALGYDSSSPSGLSRGGKIGALTSAHSGKPQFQSRRPRPDFDSGISENLRDARLADPGCRTEYRHGGPVGVFLDEVTEVEVRHFTGHVYNLSCNSEWYIANGIISHNCHHNYIAREHHFGADVWVTRKGAVRARSGDLGIIPGSMGAKSYIVCGKGHAESFCSCSHGAGRKMSRTAAKGLFTLLDHENATEGVECRKDEGVLDETPAAYKDIDDVMEAQKDLVDVVHTLKQVLCVKG